MSNILEVRHLTKKYKDGDREIVALNDISFKLQQGHDLAILGPSGSGKTTLLQLAGGLDSMSSGEVILNGKKLSEMNDEEISIFRNRTMGFIFQMINLQEYFTAKENIMLPMLIANISKEEASKRADKLLKKVGLDHRSTHLPKQLSRGEQQRVAIARALANNPKIIFSDEPTGNLDKENSKIVINLLEDLAKENKTSVIMITHNEEIAKRFSRIIRLRGGSVIS